MNTNKTSIISCSVKLVARFLFRFVFYKTLLKRYKKKSVVNPKRKFLAIDSKN